MKLEEIVKIVDNLNEIVFEQTENEYLRGEPSFEVRTDGHIHSVHFAGVCLWDSESDMREYTDEAPEPLENYLRRESMEYFKIISKIKL